jgi:hypothetical protein
MASIDEADAAGALWRLQVVHAERARPSCVTQPLGPPARAGLNLGSAGRCCVCVWRGSSTHALGPDRAYCPSAIARNSIPAITLGKPVVSGRAAPFIRLSPDETVPTTVDAVIQFVTN